MERCAVAYLTHWVGVRSEAESSMVGALRWMSHKQDMEEEATAPVTMYRDYKGAQDVCVWTRLKCRSTTRMASTTSSTMMRECNTSLRMSVRTERNTCHVPSLVHTLVRSRAGVLWRGHSLLHQRCGRRCVLDECMIGSGGGGRRARAAGGGAGVRRRDPHTHKGDGRGEGCGGADLEGGELDDGARPGDRVEGHSRAHAAGKG